LLLIFIFCRYALENVDDQNQDKKGE
jgi:hypothetical protein